jgi:hypothetical protein
MNAGPLSRLGLLLALLCALAGAAQAAEPVLLPTGR